jgi:hypothetical protein
MNFYGRKDNIEDTGAIDGTKIYNEAGKVAYNAYIIARGLCEEVAFENLVWAEQHSWCEAARAARSIL